MSDAVTSPTLALPSWGYKIKKAAWISFAVLAFLLAAIVVVPHFVDLGLFKRTYLPRVEEALEPACRCRRSSAKSYSDAFDPHVQSKSLRHLPGNADNTFFSAQQVQLRLRFWPLHEGPFRSFRAGVRQTHS